MNDDEIKARFASMEAMTNFEPFVQLMRSMIKALEAEGFTRDQACRMLAAVFERQGQQ